MKTILLPVALLFQFTLQAQYYYNDITGTQETNRLMKTYLANKVQTVSAAGFDPRGIKATGFSEFQEVKENGLALKTSSITNLNKTIIYTRFDKEARVISMTDSSTGLQSVTTYDYDAAGNITRVQNKIKDTANDFDQTETHQWIYNVSGKPEKMWRIITSTVTGTGTDSLEVRFATDEDGNIGEERTYKKGTETGYLYYYYDEKNRLSDIVRYNTKRKKLMPDIMFEYDDNDRVIQKITTTSSLNLGYLIWRYLFDEKGLKTKEALFNNDKQLTGKIEYNYTFGK
jgi:YD repeat-containing protein